jgi:hypothetical protein
MRIFSALDFQNPVAKMPTNANLRGQILAIITFNDNNN